MATKIAVVYSSKHGHVRTIAQRLAEIAAVRRVECEIADVRASRDLLEGCDAAIIAGSVHFDRHAGRLRRFVERKLFWLSRHPSAFVSVSGAAGSLEGGPKAEGYLRNFLRITGWQPDMSLSAAGAVLYTKYGWVTRLMMKFASRTAGRADDPKYDVVYTNWKSLDEFMHQFLDSLERHATVARPQTRSLVPESVF